MQLQRVSLTVSQLRCIPDDERSLIVVLAHALNETNALNKLLFLCTNIDHEPQWKAHAHASQAFILARTLVGKLNEAWNTIQVGYFRSKISVAYSNSLEATATEALNHLKSYFGRKNLLNEVRNNFAFHYSLEHAKTCIPEDTPAEDLTIYLHERNGNSLYQFAEYIMSKALIDTTSPTDPEAALGTLLSEMSTVVAALNEFVQGLLFVVLDKHIGEEVLRQSAQKVDVGAVPLSSDITIPYFFEVARPMQGRAA